MRTATVLLMAAVSLGLIAWGAWMVYPPAGPLAAGVLLWIDVALWGYGK